MHISLRWFIFTVFALIFVISAPIAVLYTAGYRLNISNRHIQQTGVLAISTYPKNASITLNGQVLASKSPYVVQHIMPNTHELTLSKKGYHSWSQNVRIDEGKTTYVTARLFADSQPEQLNASASALALRSRKLPNPITVDEASVSFLNNGANIEVHTGAGSTDQLLALLPLGTYNLLEEDTEYILVVNEKQVAFVIARQGGNVVALPAHLTAFDWLANDNLLIWTDGSEVNTFDADSGENTFITRSSQAIIDVAWHPEADSFFVATTSSIDAYDRSVYEARQIVHLVTNVKIADIWLDASGKNLFYLPTLPAENSDASTLVTELPLTL